MFKSLRAGESSQPWTVKQGYKLTMSQNTHNTSYYPFLRLGSSRIQQIPDSRIQTKVQVTSLKKKHYDIALVIFLENIYYNTSLLNEKTLLSVLVPVLTKIKQNKFLKKDILPLFFPFLFAI